MELISFDKWWEMNPSLAKTQTKEQALKNAREAKDKCMICGGKTWRAFAAIGGSDMCFQCVTGEWDDADDYEVILPAEKEGDRCGS